MKRNLELENRAKEDYKQLQKIINENQNLTFEELCYKLGGHNYDNGFKRFDLNFKSICATIHFINNKFVLDSLIEIWNDDECCLYDNAYNMNVKEN